MPDLQVLKESSDYRVLYKPSYMHSTRGTSSEKSVEDLLWERFSDLRKIPEAGIVHRLDYETTGCLVVAKNLESYKRLKQAFRSGEGVQKIYLAIVRGEPKKTNFDLYFRSRYKSSKKISVFKTGSEKERGRARWKILSQKPPYSILEVELLGPGKRHQIRAGLASLGFPLRGDTLYGGEPLHESFGLHAWKVEIDGEWTEAPSPFN